MTVRYVYNTKGEYVAFIYNNNLFSPDSEWIGFLPQGNLVFNCDGSFLGEIASDDRILRNKNISYQKLLRPLKPLKPLRPLRPLRRLAVMKPPHPYFDVFEDTGRFSPAATVQNFDYLEGCKIIANNVFLGKITKNSFDTQSIFNQYTYGSRYSQTSIFNEYCPYGGLYGQHSPLNPYSSSPPAIYRGHQLVAYLTVNQYVGGEKIDPNKFFIWVQNQ